MDLLKSSVDPVYSLCADFKNNSHIYLNDLILLPCLQALRLLSYLQSLGDDVRLLGWSWKKKSPRVAPSWAWAEKGRRGRRKEPGQCPKENHHGNLATSCAWAWSAALVQTWVRPSKRVCLFLERQHGWAVLMKSPGLDWTGRQTNKNVWAWPSLGLEPEGELVESENQVNSPRGLADAAPSRA